METEEEALEILARLAAGEDFAALAQELSTDTGSGAEGGDLGVVSPGQTVPEFEEAVFAATVGEPVGPVQTQFGFHVIEVTDRSEGRSLAEASDEIREELLAQQRVSAVQEWLAARTADAEVVVNPRFGAYDPATGEVTSGDPLGDLVTPAPEGGVPGIGADGLPIDPGAPPPPDPNAPATQGQ